MAETNPERSSGGGVNWLTQEEIDAEQRELDLSIERDKVWLRIAIGLVLIYAGYILYGMVADYLP